MSITRTTGSAPWLLLIFTLPAKKASERVGIWRKLQRYGTLSLRNSGYVLPNTPTNRERFEWLATSIRGSKGEASVVLVQAFDDLPDHILKEKFRDERKPDYTAVIRETQSLKISEQECSVQLARLKRRLEEIREIDFFQSPMSLKAEEALVRTQQKSRTDIRVKRGRSSIADYQNRIWLTRPRPGIDRVSSGWLIKRFIDTNSRFIFGSNPEVHPDAIPFDMYTSVGFGHEGDSCTFETICRRFGLRDKKVLLISKIIHDADIEDGKFGREEGIVLNQVLKGWAGSEISDDELMQRGIDVIEGLYRAIS